MNTSSNSIRARATEVARDLLLENNDAPVSVETLLALCYVRAWTDAARMTTRHQRVVSGTGNASEQRELAALCRGLVSRV